MPPFHQQLLDLLHERKPTPEPGLPAASALAAFALSADDARRLDQFAELSPLYRRFLLTRPLDLPWLLEPPPDERTANGEQAPDEWRRFRGDLKRSDADYLSRLRLFRRRMSMRIAWRDISAQHTVQRSVRELSALAELCIRECYEIALAGWKERWGEPWDDALGQPARFCVLALGKLGGRELNFSSDIDLIYFYEGDGQCRKGGQPGPSTSQRFFTKVAETFTHHLQGQTEHGFLFRVDLRLRPEGGRSALVRSFAGMENYYAAAGQSWERLALIKARPVAGALALGGELLESLHSFRYPRHPPASLIGEIAAMKTRTENEVVGASNLRRNVKSGYGGIREIEFIVQTLQLLHAGRFPFLQTGSTVEGLEQLVRYELMDRADARFLRDAYWFLRAVEHRLQIREERQTHALPGEPEQMDLLARSLGFDGAAAFEAQLDETRDGVRSRYDDLLRSAPVDEELQDWWMFFAEQKASSRVERSLRRWFGDTDEAHGLMRDFLQGSRSFLLTREQVSRFTGLVRHFDRVMPQLALPLEAIRRISRFAESYGTRSHFLSACSLNPSFFEVLALLFDRSEFIFNLLCQHPEILDEVLRPEILRRRKSVEETLEELSAGAPGESVEDWLWLYVKAEQIRIAIGDLLGYLEQAETESNLTVLADSVLRFLVDRHDPDGRLLVIALGKYGGGEMTFGSDLDLLFLAEADDTERGAAVVRGLAKCLSHRRALGSIYETDLRLRPHGRDGPMTPTLSALRKYYDRQAQSWEKQVLARARVVTGNPRLRGEFDGFLRDLLYKEPTGTQELEELWRMRIRIERERDRTDPPQRAFKTGAGGIVDLEFFCQFLQLAYGHRHPELRHPNTRRLLRAIGDLGLMDESQNATLLENFDFLKRVEVLLRRNQNAAISVIGPSPDEQFALARWSGYRTTEAFWSDHCRAMATTRKIVVAFLTEKLGLDFETECPEPSES